MSSSKADAADHRTGDESTDLVEYGALLDEFKRASGKANRNASQNSPAERGDPPVGMRAKKQLSGALIVVAVFLALVAGVSVTIVQAKHRSDANKARRAAAYTAGQASVAASVRTGRVECHVQFLDGATKKAIAAKKHYPCNRVPLEPADNNMNDQYATVVIVHGVSSVLANRYGIELDCKGSYGNTGSSNPVYDRKLVPRGKEMQASVEGMAGEVVDGPISPTDCQVRGNNLGVIRTVHIKMRVDKRHRFKR